ncbi:MAG: hypothetical protein KDN19_12445 [Verrucomicrobiae bacterium]|nr:hypothetical protein [Verrucomicrobiae bacterium]
MPRTASLRWLRPIWWVAVLTGVSLTLQAAPPRVGYVYPAGGQVGATFEAELGGQYLGDPIDVIISGEGVTAEVLEHNKVPSAQMISDFRDRLRSVQPALREVRGGSDVPAAEVMPKILELLKEAELTETDVRHIDQYTRERNDPKRQLNSQIGETVRVRFTVSASAEPGLRFCRLITESGLSNPLRFVIGRLPEYREPEVWNFRLPTYLGIETMPEEEVGTRGPVALPATLNGRILPGEVDEFLFKASEGDQVVVSLEARSLIPYLADAVPGWFQAVVSLEDTRGNELAFADDYRFNPDPVLFFKMPRDGEYRLKVHDSIFRGREDFVYRVTVGELPFLTAISPLGGQAGSEVDLVLEGGNLTEHERKRFALPEEPGMMLITAMGATGESNAIPFHVADIPEDRERESNDRIGAANELELPGIVNGAIGWPGDQDFFRVKGKGNRPMTFEIFARRLGSPLDANLTVFDDDGKQIAWNDDFENPSAGLTTHHADPRVTVKLPADGQVFVRVADTQNSGGYAHSYRLRVSQGIPEVFLRATPSSLNAKPGGTAQLTVHALRMDDFEGAVKLRLKEAPQGFSLKSDTIPAGEESAQIALAVSSTATEGPVPIVLEAVAEVEGEAPFALKVVPAEDMMQAFIRHHLVPVDSLLVDVREPPEPAVR